MLLPRSIRLWTFALSLTVSVQAQSGPTASKIVEKDLAFPSPVQWNANIAEISLIHVAWGPADSREMMARGRQKMAQEKAAFYPDRSYVLALGFKAKFVGAIPTNSYSSSGLVRVKNTDGETEAPMVLTSEGFVPFAGSPGVYDVHFDKSTTTEYWDLFPAAPDQKEFLFQVFPGVVRANVPRFSFRIILRGNEIAVVDASPQPATACPNFHRAFAGTVGAGTRVNIQLAGENSTLLGTEQYERVGKSLWLKGTADSLGNFVIEERFPENQITGIFKGKFSDNCQVMQGYFSKPDGSRLQPFEFRQVHSVGTQQQ